MDLEYFPGVSVSPAATDVAEVRLGICWDVFLVSLAVRGATCNGWRTLATVALKTREWRGQGGCKGWCTWDRWERVDVGGRHPLKIGSPWGQVERHPLFRRTRLGGNRSSWETDVTEEVGGISEAGDESLVKEDRRASGVTQRVG